MRRSFHYYTVSIEEENIDRGRNMIRRNNNYKVLKICIVIVIAFIVLGLLSWRPVPHIDAALENYENNINIEKQNQQIDEQELLP